MRPAVNVTSSRSCDISSHPAPRRAGVMNFVQMSRSERLALSIRPQRPPVLCRFTSVLPHPSSPQRCRAPSAARTPPPRAPRPPDARTWRPLRARRARGRSVDRNRTSRPWSLASRMRSLQMVAPKCWPVWPTCASRTATPSRSTTETPRGSLGKPLAAASDGSDTF